MLVNTSIGAILPIPGAGGVTRPDDTFRSILYRIQSDGTLQLLRIADWNFVPPPTASSFLDSAPFETSVLALVTTAGFLDLSPAAPVFSYYVETYARDAGEFTERVDRVPSSGAITCDLRAVAVAPLNTSPATGVVRSGLPTPFFFGIDGAQIAGTVNQDVLAVRRTQDVLLLHHHNAASAQAEVVTLQSSRSAPTTTPPAGIGSICRSSQHRSNRRQRQNRQGSAFASPPCLCCRGLARRFGKRNTIVCVAKHGI
jgi:hypothetical protein